jgi:hypothetical protein
MHRSLLFLVLANLCFSGIESQIKKNCNDPSLEWNHYCLINRTLDFDLIDNDVIIDLFEFDLKKQNAVEPPESPLFNNRNQLKV